MRIWYIFCLSCQTKDTFRVNSRLYLYCKNCHLEKHWSCPSITDYCFFSYPDMIQKQPMKSWWVLKCQLQGNYQSLPAQPVPETEPSTQDPRTQVFCPVWCWGSDSWEKEFDTRRKFHYLCPEALGTAYREQSEERREGWEDIHYCVSSWVVSPFKNG